MILLAIDFHTFDFNFFRGYVDPLILDLITINFESTIDGINAIKKLYSLDLSTLTSVDELAINLFLRFYSINGTEDFDSDILNNIAYLKDKNLLKAYTRKNKLTKDDKDKLINKKISLKSLIKDGL